MKVVISINGKKERLIHQKKTNKNPWLDKSVSSITTIHKFHHQQIIKEHIIHEHLEQVEANPHAAGVAEKMFDVEGLRAAQHNSPSQVVHLEATRIHYGLNQH